MDYENLWFETRDDTIKAIVCYLNLIYRTDIKLSEDIFQLSKKIEKILQKKLLLKYLQFYLKHRGVKLNNFLLKTINYPAQVYLNFLYNDELKKTFNLSKIGISLKDPGLKLYSSLLPCLYSINKNKRINLKLLEESRKLINRLFPIQKFNNNSPFSDWENLCKSYTRAFRVYQFLKI